MAQNPDIIKVDTPTDTFVLRGRPCELSAFSYIPPDRQKQTAELRTYFSVPRPPHKDRKTSSVYDRTYNLDFGYNQHLLREDRQHFNSRELYVNDEERCRTVPCLSSSLYGHRLPSDIDPLERKHGHVEIIKSEFWRNNSVNLTPDIERHTVIEKT